MTDRKNLPMRRLQQRREELLTLLGAFELAPTYQRAKAIDEAWRHYRLEVSMETFVMGCPVEFTEPAGGYPAGTTGEIVPVLSTEGTLPVEIDGTRTDPEEVGVIVEVAATALRRRPWEWEGR